MQNFHGTKSLRKIHMLAELPPWQLEVVAEAVEPVDTRKGTWVVERGSDDGYTYFLDDGKISLEAADGQKKEVALTPESARDPIANLRPRLFGVKALTRITGLRIPDIVLSAAGCNGRSPAPDTIVVRSEEEEQRQEAESKLSFQLYRDLTRDEAILPSLPDLAMRIRKAIDDDVSDAKTVARLVEIDPAMATKLLKAANSALYGGLNSIDTCMGAVVRMGMETTKQLVLSFALKEVFSNRDPLVKRRMQELWKHSAHIAALCFVLAREIKGMSSEEALLIGLVHDIGTIAILNYIHKYPELAQDEPTLEETIVRMRGELGAMILRKWNFPHAVVAGARDAEDWLRRRDQKADFTDLLIVAQVHERLRAHQLEGLPPLDQISAIQRVLGEDSSPEKSLEILHAAKAQVEEMRSVLRG